jgi:uncharacterized protein
MRRLVPLAILLLIAASAGAAEAPTEKIRELIRLMDPQAAFRVGIEMALDAEHRQSIAQLDAIAASDPDKLAQVEARKEEVTDIHRRLLPLLWKHIDFERFSEEVIVPIYRQNVSEADIDALIEFYRSPAGRRQVELMPTILRSSSEASEAFFAPALEKVFEELEAPEEAP